MVMQWKCFSYGPGVAHVVNTLIIGESLSIIQEPFPADFALIIFFTFGITIDKAFCARMKLEL
jgi:hypothetical protein